MVLLLEVLLLHDDHDVASDLAHDGDELLEDGGRKGQSYYCPLVAGAVVVHGGAARLLYLVVQPLRRGTRHATRRDQLVSRG